MPGVADMCRWSGHQLPVQDGSFSDLTRTNPTPIPHLEKGLANDVVMENALHE